ncbi:MAG TPA: aspartate ammonia-lyase [Terriglobales bacterium]|nr:aspartate ammonia-lyase [Terriglobales bacterium]
MEKTGAVRRERDSLGEHAVPRRALYGIQTQRAVENYPISGQRAAPALIAAYGYVKWAMAAANRQLGRLPAAQARAIQRAALEVAEHQHDEQFVVDVFQAGAGVSFHMNVNEVVANRAAELLGGARGRYDRVHPNDHVNLGQSTNDTYPAAARIALRLEFDELLAAVEDCQRAFAAKGRAFRGIVKAGRTHLQDAVPIRLGREFTAYAAALGAGARGLRQAGDDLLELGLGGSAAGTGLNVPPRAAALALQHLRQRTRHRWRQAPDLVAAMQSQLALAAASAAMRNLALELIRIGNDLRLLSSGPRTGLQEIELPALQPGSSIMPGKVNPVMPEMLAMVAFQVVGNDTATALAAQAGQLELNVMMPAMAHATLQSAAILARALRAFTTKCVAGIRADRQRCEAYAHATLALATGLNPYVGYARTAKLVQEALRSGRGLLELAREQRLLPEADLRRLLDPALAADGGQATPRRSRTSPHFSPPPSRNAREAAPARRVPFSARRRT